MRKTLMNLLAVMLISLMTFGVIPAHAAEKISPQPEKTPVNLSDQQIKELASLQKEVLEKQKNVISKKVEYGVISKEKGDKIMAHLEHHYARMEKNGFTHKWDKSKMKHFRKCEK